MAIVDVFVDQVQKAYIAYYGRPADQIGLDYWTNEIAKTSGDLSSIIDAFGNSAEANSLFGGLSHQQTVNTLFNQLFGRDADVDGLLFYANGLSAGTMTAQSIALNILNGAQNDDAAIVANKLAVAKSFTTALDTSAEIVAYSGDQAAATARSTLAGVDQNTDTAAFDVNAPIAQVVSGGSSTAGTTFTLTDSVDNLTGTAGNNTFYAGFADNTNTLQSGDTINGGAGTDTLKADLGDHANFAIAAKTTGVEVVEIRAQAQARDTADNNVSDSSLDTNSQVDAQDMAGVDQWWSTDSRANLLIEDVRIEDTEITKDITIGMRNTDAGDVNYEVYFDHQSLRKAPAVAEGAQLNLRLMDLKNAKDGEFLKEDPYIGFSFKLDGNDIQVTADAIKAATTYDELLVAVQEAVASTAGLENFTVAKSGAFTGTDNDGLQYQGDVITLTNNGSGEITSGGWQIGPDGVPGDSNLLAQQDNSAADLTDFLVTSDIVVDNVGRGSKSGDLVIGSMSQGDYSNSTGVQQFDVEVQRDSWLGNMRSTNNSLEVVNVVNSAAEGNLTLDGGVDNTHGLTDVRVFNAGEMKGVVTLKAELTDNVITKYFNKTDAAPDAASSDNVKFVYTTGAGDDKLTLDVSEEAIAYEDFELSISTGAGNDEVTVDLLDNAGGLDLNWLSDQQMLNNYSIETGAGDDVVKTLGEGDASIVTGTGNDDVYTDNTGNKAAWVYNAANSDLTDLLGKASSSALLYKAALTVNFLGFTAQVTVPTSNLAADNTSINQAIKEAINGDRVLSSLLKAEDGANNTLVVSSLIDGAHDTTNLDFSIETVQYDTLNQSEINELTSYLRKAAADSTLVVDQADIEAALQAGTNAMSAAYGDEQQALVGTVSGDTSNNTVNVNNHDDVIVLGTGTGADSVVFTGYNNGIVSIAHYTNADSLDFSSYLDTAVSASGSVTSTVPAAGTANNVVALSMTQTADDSFANLDAATLLNALQKNSESYANLDENSLNALRVDVANLVGNDRDHIIEVKHASNVGVSKFFHVISTENADGSVEFSSANFISIVDVGNEGGVAPTAPTYALVSDAANADEGTTASFTLTTTNVADGTAVNYALSGVDAADVTGGLLSGTAIVNSGTASINVALAADTTTEGAETLVVTAEGQTASTVVNDTSVDGSAPGVSADVGTAASVVTLDAGTGTFQFNDDAAVTNNIIINNFTSDDFIAVSNIPTGANYSFTNNGADVGITYNNSGTLNQISLVGVVDATALVYDEASFESAIGFDAFQIV